MYSFYFKYFFNNVEIKIAHLQLHQYLNHTFYRNRIIIYNMMFWEPKMRKKKNSFYRVYNVHGTDVGHPLDRVTEEEKNTFYVWDRNHLVKPQFPTGRKKLLCGHFDRLVRYVFRWQNVTTINTAMLVNHFSLTLYEPWLTM